MIFSQGLIISLGFTLLIAVLLFFYVRQRTNAVEDKINTLIQFVQTETLKLQQTPPPVGEMSVYQVPTTSPVTTSEHVNGLIDVSDDDSTTASDSDSDDESSSDYDSSSEDESVTDENEAQTTRTVAMQPVETTDTNNVEDEDVIHLHVLRPDESSKGELVTGDEHISNNLEEELDALTLSDLSSGEDNEDDEDNDEDNDETTESGVDDSGSPIVNYKKMLVSQLRMVAEQKGLVEDSRKFKKSELIALLEKQ